MLTTVDAVARVRCAVLCRAQDPTASLETLLKALPDGSAPKATYVKGDKVEVIAGDLTSLTGEIVG